MNTINIAAYCEGFDFTGFNPDSFGNAIQYDATKKQYYWPLYNLKSFFTQLQSWFESIAIPAGQEAYYTKKFDKLCRSLQSIMQNNAYPDDYFDNLGFGSYKECYETGIPSWTIKFASISNPTRDEISAIEDVKKERLDYLLPKTIYLELPFSIPLSLLEQEPNPNYEGTNDDSPDAWVYQYADYIILQEECRTILDYTDGQTIPLKNAILDMTNIRICNEYLKVEEINQLFYIDCIWVTLLLEKFGKDAAIRFNKFLNTYCWDDLRPVNIGVNSQGNPVIFDWMSSQ